MKIEHVALNVADPVAAAQWYVKHLGMTLRARMDKAPFMCLVADPAQDVMIEFFTFETAPMPDYASMNCGLQVKIKVESPDPTRTCDVLLFSGEANALDGKGRAAIDAASLPLPISTEDRVKYQFTLNNDQGGASNWIIGSLILDDVTVTTLPQNPTYLFYTVE